MMYLTLTAFLLVFILIGIYAGKDIVHDNTEGYFMADRKLNKWQIGISAGATANSGFIVVGAVGMGYTMGMSSLIYPLAWLLGDLFFWYLFAERIRNNSAVNHSITVPEVFTFENKNGLLRVISGLIILILLVIYASSQFIASVKVVSSFIDISSQIALLLSFFMVMAYTAWGGFKSSVWTDIAQGIMMLLLTLGMLVWGILEIGGLGSFISQLQSLGEGYMSLFGEKGLGAIVAFSLGFAFTGFGFSMSQPQVISRIFAANSSSEVKSSKWIYIGFLHFTWMGMCVIGMISKILMPELPDPEIALPSLAKEYFPDFLVGLVFAAMLATILSSIDSLLVASTSAFSVDFGLDKKVPNEKRVLFYRFVILFIGTLSLLFAIYLESTVFAVALFAVSVMTASIGSTMVLIILNLVHSSTALLLSVVSGFTTAIIWRILGYEDTISDGFIGFVTAIFLSIIYEKFIRTKKDT